MSYAHKPKAGRPGWRLYEEGDTPPPPVFGVRKRGARYFFDHATYDMSRKCWLQHSVASQGSREHGDRYLANRARASSWQASNPNALASDGLAAGTFPAWHLSRNGYIDRDQFWLVAAGPAGSTQIKTGLMMRVAEDDGSVIDPGDILAPLYDDRILRFTYDYAPGGDPLTAFLINPANFTSNGARDKIFTYAQSDGNWFSWIVSSNIATTDMREVLNQNLRFVTDEGGGVYADEAPGSGRVSKDFIDATAHVDMLNPQDLFGAIGNQALSMAGVAKSNAAHLVAGGASSSFNAGQNNGFLNFMYPHEDFLEDCLADGKIPQVFLPELVGSPMRHAKLKSFTNGSGEKVVAFSCDDPHRSNFAVVGGTQTGPGTWVVDSDGYVEATLPDDQAQQFCKIEVTWDDDDFGSQTGWLSFRYERSETTLNAGASGGATAISVASTGGFGGGDPVRITLDDASTHTTTIASTSGSHTINLDDALPSGASSGNAVVRPFNTIPLSLSAPGDNVDCFSALNAASIMASPVWPREAGAFMDRLQASGWPQNLPFGINIGVEGEWNPGNPWLFGWHYFWGLARALGGGPNVGRGVGVVYGCWMQAIREEQSARGTNYQIIFSPYSQTAWADNYAANFYSGLNDFLTARSLDPADYVGPGKLEHFCTTYTNGEYGVNGASGQTDDASNTAWWLDHIADGTAADILYRKLIDESAVYGWGNFAQIMSWWAENHAVVQSNATGVPTCLGGAYEGVNDGGGGAPSSLRSQPSFQAFWASEEYGERRAAFYRKLHNAIIETYGPYCTAHPIILPAFQWADSRSLTQPWPMGILEAKTPLRSMLKEYGRL